MKAIHLCASVLAMALVASAAILDEDTVLTEERLNTRLTHSQTLLPMIDELVRKAELKAGELDAIAVSDAITELKARDKWLIQIADNQLANSPDERDNRETYQYKKGIWDGLQIAWNIVVKS